MADHMKKPCPHCPFRRDVTPFLHPARAEEIAYSALNPYSDFHCHTTTVEDEESDEGQMLVTADSKTCAGWLGLAINEGAQRAPEGFEIPANIYDEPDTMIDAYTEEWARDRSNPAIPATPSHGEK